MATSSSRTCSNSARRSIRPSFLPTCQSAVCMILTTGGGSAGGALFSPEHAGMACSETSWRSWQPLERVLLLYRLLLAGGPRREGEREHEGGRDARLEQHHGPRLEEAGPPPGGGGHPPPLAAVPPRGAAAARGAGRGGLRHRPGAARGGRL